MNQAQTIRELVQYCRADYKEQIEKLQVSIKEVQAKLSVLDDIENKLVPQPAFLTKEPIHCWIIESVKKGIFRGFVPSSSNKPQFKEGAYHTGIRYSTKEDALNACHKILKGPEVFDDLRIVPLFKDGTTSNTLIEEVKYEELI